MQFKTLIATAASLIAFVNAEAAQNYVQFYAESDIKEINGKGLSSIHEGAALNYFFLGEDPEILDYNPETGAISSSLNTGDGQSIDLAFEASVGSRFPTLQVTAGAQTATSWTFEDGYLKGNGSQNFFVAKNTSDPYRYSEKSYQVALFPEGASTSGFVDVHPIKIKVTQSAVL
ncbi:putative secreted protein [Wickerhamomyces ciferrii]|uniref:Secreted protein n=1 Tax=Wickerhamomyces ciferrii (strain ATCC 14091 / BCRC 22168 / CBS 111 / JCM 3599 / NBRC 0793 / NRRL Y-1031 F-60-10) TaxID=1206466 RepID=K0KJ07_WICCF|nr:uncharacterized protein BN7_645 [Wickerhamomyces ciferrii]CCH41108.1 putative secreted protein [Wickerhamomyces ciferrii]